MDWEEVEMEFWGWRETLKEIEHARRNAQVVAKWALAAP